MTHFKMVVSSLIDYISNEVSKLADIANNLSSSDDDYFYLSGMIAGLNDVIIILSHYLDE